jgi:hypothetical protein
MTRSRRALPLWSVLAIGVCLLGQLAGSVHTAAVQHVACSEHGGVVELHIDRAPATEATHTAIRASIEESHHAHCEGCATPTARFSASAPAARRSPAVMVITARAKSSPRTDTIVRFRLAPKGSPPRSA